MKIIAFTDIHAGQAAFKKLEKKVKKHKPDFVLCAGDFTVFEQHMAKILKRISKLGKVYLIHGNHEIVSRVRKICLSSGVIYAHKKLLKLKQYYLFSQGGGGFSYKDKDFEELVKKKAAQLKGKKLIFMTHAPPYNTKVDYIKYLDDHVGCRSYTSFIKKYKPVLAVSGHIHETFKEEGKIGKTRIINPGPDGVLIEL